MENFDYMEIRSEEFQEILGQRPPWVVRYGIILLIVFMIILLGGAWLFKYPQTIEGKLVLASSIPSVQLESKVTGIITDVYVKDGQKVEQGEKLALIQNTANVNDIELLEKNIAEWYHAVDNGKVCQKSRQKLVLGAIQVSYSSLLVKIDAYNRFVSWDPYKSKIAAQNEKLHISRDRHKISVSQKEISEKELKIKEGSLRRHEILYAKGLISKEEFEASETKYLQERMSIESARLNINENYSKELELTSNVISLEHERLERLSSLQVDIIASLEQVSSEIQKWKDSYLLVSPIQGIVTFTNIWGAYQNVEAGIIVFNIIPTPQKELIGKLTMNMMRSGKVKKISLSISILIIIRSENLAWLKGSLKVSL